MAKACATTFPGRMREMSGRYEATRKQGYKGRILSIDTLREFDMFFITGGAVLFTVGIRLRSGEGGDRSSGRRLDFWNYGRDRPLRR